MPEPSATIVRTENVSQMPAITASRTRASFFDPTSRPYITTNANGMTRIAQSSTKSVTGVGFSNGCAELVL